MNEGRPGGRSRNLTPADTLGRGETDVAERRRIKRQTFHNRHLNLCVK